jgi:hypothetical protein
MLFPFRVVVANFAFLFVLLLDFAFSVEILLKIEVRMSVRVLNYELTKFQFLMEACDFRYRIIVEISLLL